MERTIKCISGYSPIYPIRNSKMEKQSCRNKRRSRAITRGLYSFFQTFDVSNKNVVFWDMTPSIPVEIIQRFGKTYCLHFQAAFSRGRW